MSGYEAGKASKYADYLINDPDTPKELLEVQAKYGVLTPEE